MSPNDFAECDCCSEPVDPVPYRGAAHTMIDGFQAGVIDGITAELANRPELTDKLAAVKEFVMSQDGRLAIGHLLSTGLPMIPGFKDDERISRLATEIAVASHNEADEQEIAAFQAFVKQYANGDGK